MGGGDPQRPEEGIRSSEGAVMCGWSCPTQVLGAESQFSSRAVRTHSQWAISPGPNLVFGAGMTVSLSFLLFETGSYTPWDNLELPMQAINNFEVLILLPLPVKYWDSFPYPVYEVLGIKPKASRMLGRHSANWVHLYSAPIIYFLSAAWFLHSCSCEQCSKGKMGSVTDIIGLFWLFP